MPARAATSEIVGSAGHLRPRQTKGIESEGPNWTLTRGQRGGLSRWDGAVIGRLDGNNDLERFGVDTVIGGNCDGFVLRDGYGGECIGYFELDSLARIQLGLYDVGFPSTVLLYLAKQLRNCAEGKNILRNLIR